MDIGTKTTKEVQVGGSFFPQFVCLSGIGQDGGMTFEGPRAEGMFWMKVGSREQQCLRSCYLHGFLEYPLTIFAPQAALNDEHGVCADHDANIGHQVDVLVRNHHDPWSNFPGQCWLNQGRTVELRHHIFSNQELEGGKTPLTETKAPF